MVSYREMKKALMAYKEVLRLVKRLPEDTRPYYAKYVRENFVNYREIDANDSVSLQELLQRTYNHSIWILKKVRTLPPLLFFAQHSYQFIRCLSHVLVVIPFASCTQFGVSVISVFGGPIGCEQAEGDLLCLIVLVMPTNCLLIFSKEAGQEFTLVLLLQSLISRH